MNKLFQLILGFTDEDWRLYNKFSKNRYATSSSVDKIYKYIYKHRKQFNFHSLNNRYLQKKLCIDLPHKSFDNLVSKLIGHIEAYLIWSEANMPANKNLLLLAALQRRKIFDQTEILCAHQNLNSQVKELSFNSNFNHYRFLHESYFNTNPVINKTKEETLRKCLQAFILFTSRTAHYYKLELKSRNLILNDNWKNMINILDIFPVDKTDPYIIIINNLLSLQAQKSNAIFLNTFKLLSQKNLSLKTKETITIHLTNYLWSQARSGNMEHSTKLLDLYKQDIKIKLEDKRYKIPVDRYHNIVDSACGFKEFDWATSFIENNQDNLSTKFQVPTKNLALAQLYFGKNQFAETIQQLARIKYKNTHQELRAKSLLLRSHFELESHNYSFIKTQIDSFNRYLNRSKFKLGNSIFFGLQTLSRYIQKLVEGESRETLKKELKLEKYLIFRIWLEEKLEEEAKHKASPL